MWGTSDRYYVTFIQLILSAQPAGCGFYILILRNNPACLETRHETKLPHRPRAPEIGNTCALLVVAAAASTG